VSITGERILSIVEEARLVETDVAARVRRRLARGGDPYELIAYLGRVPRQAVARAVAERYGLDFATADAVRADEAALRRLPENLLQHDLLPLADGSRVAIADPDDQALVGTVQRHLSRRMRPVLVERRELERARRRHLPGTGPGASATDAIALVDELLGEAWCHRATDCHLEALPGGYRFRLRIDGRLHTVEDGIDPGVAAAMVGRIKVLAGMDVAENREAQDGGFRHVVAGADHRPVDCRAATAPSRLGERVAVRLLGVDTEDLTLERLGIAEDVRTRLTATLADTHGLVLVTGATGSGKSTTLYAALRHLNTDERNILTVEDPIEYTVPGVSQVQVDHVGKVTFASAMRSFLRHDPDVIMVGEIRDGETLTMALRAALTGHLVLSTLHTNTAAGAVTRLLDMGAEPYLVAGSLRLVLAQRLLRRLCPHCKRRVALPPDELPPAWRGDPPTDTCEPVGCAACHGTGYRGRVAVFESLPIDEDVRRAIDGRRDEADLVAAAGAAFRPWRDDLRRRCEEGLVAVDDVRRLIRIHEVPA